MGLGWVGKSGKKKKQFARASIDRVSFSIDQALPKLNGNFLQLLDSNFTHKHTLSSLNLDLMFWLWFANTLQVEVLIHLDPNFLEPNKNENNNNNRKKIKKCQPFTTKKKKKK